MHCIWLFVLLQSCANVTFFCKRKNACCRTAALPPQRIRLHLRTACTNAQSMNPLTLEIPLGLRRLKIIPLTACCVIFHFLKYPFITLFWLMTLTTVQLSYLAMYMISLQLMICHYTSMICQLKAETCCGCYNHLPAISNESVMPKNAKTGWFLHIMHTKRLSCW